jgi:RNA-directed DNA polymerase
MHHVTVDVLRHAFFPLRKRAAAGVNQVTWTDYPEGLEARLDDLHDQLHRGTYRALPSRRSEISEAGGGKWKLSVGAMDDKVVQAAHVSILTLIYEAQFLGFSYGFRPGRGQHDALDALGFAIKGRNVRWTLTADIRSFFDTINHDWLIKFIGHRIGKGRPPDCQTAEGGVMENGLKVTTEEGPPQGAVISPLLANIYVQDVYWIVRIERVPLGDSPEACPVRVSQHAHRDHVHAVSQRRRAADGRHH